MALRGITLMATGAGRVFLSLKSKGQSGTLSRLPAFITLKHNICYVFQVQNTQGSIFVLILTNLG